MRTQCFVPENVLQSTKPTATGPNRRDDLRIELLQTFFLLCPNSLAPYRDTDNPSILNFTKNTRLSLRELSNTSRDGSSYACMLYKSYKLADFDKTIIIIDNKDLKSVLTSHRCTGDQISSQYSSEKHTNACKNL